jgi:hypothetical protein
VAAKASRSTDQGERRLEHHWRVGKVRGLRHRPFLWCVWATQCSSEHVGQVEGFSRASGGFGHDGGSPSTAAVRRAGELRGSSGVVTVWSRCAHEGAVLMCLETGDGLGLRARDMERHGRSKRSDGKQRDTGLTVGVVEDRMVMQ